MKRTSLLVSSMVVGVLVCACAGKGYTPSANEEVYGIWAAERPPQKMVMHTNGTFEYYLYLSDAQAFGNGEFKIVSKRIDTDGTIWYKMNYIEKHPGDDKRMELGKIGDHGRVWEYVNINVGDFTHYSHPIVIDKNHMSYRIYERGGAE